MSNARDKANIPALNFSSTGIDDNATSTAITIDSSENVGIGTASPSQPLDVYGSAQISYSGANTYLYFQSTLNYIGRKTDGNLHINVNGGQNIISSVYGSEKMRIDSSGNVSIGTTAPQTNFGDGRTTLALKGTGAEDYSVLILGSYGTANDTQGHGIIRFYDNNTSVAGVQSIRQSGNLSGALQFFTAPSTGGIQERMRIDMDGNVAIGRTNPSEKLDVNGSIRIKANTKIISVDATYSSGYTGDHFIFETTGMMAWCFDGVLQVQGSGGSGYGAFIQHIKIVYSRENGALDSGVTYAQGDSVFNTSTLAHGSVGLNPSPGNVGFVEVKNPDGASSERSFFKITFDRSGQGVGVNTKLMGTVYYSDALVSSHGLRVLDKDLGLKSDIV